MSDVDAIQSKSVNEDSQSFRSAQRRPSLLIKNLLTLDKSRPNKLFWGRSQRLDVQQQNTPEKLFVTKLGFHNTDYTALAIAKFLHGIDSPRAPLRVFRTHPLFGKWCESQFPLILESLEKLFMSEATNN